MASLFTPPQIEFKQRLRGWSLLYSYSVSQTVWKDQGGTWHYASTPSWEDLTAASVFYTSPAIVSDVTAAELTLAGIGTCVPIEP